MVSVWLVLQTSSTARRLKRNAPRKLRAISGLLVALADVCGLIGLGRPIDLCKAQHMGTIRASESARAAKAEATPCDR